MRPLSQPFGATSPNPLPYAAFGTPTGAETSGPPLAPACAEVAPWRLVVPARPAQAVEETAECGGVNAPSALLRTALRRPPETMAMARSAPLPVGFVVHPLYGAGECPSVDVGPRPTCATSSEPLGLSEPSPWPSLPGGRLIRCKSCKAHVSPFARWQSDGRRWSCNLCGTTQATPSAYWASVDAHGLRSDLWQRPELRAGLVEYILHEAPQTRSRHSAAGQQMPREGHGISEDAAAVSAREASLSLVFLFESSRRAVESGLLSVASEAAQAALSSGALPASAAILSIGVTAFGGNVSFYQLGAGSAQLGPRAFVVPDVEEPFLPLPPEALLDSSVEKAAAIAALAALPASRSRGEGSCLGAAITAVLPLFGPGGGKLLVVAASTPDIGVLALGVEAPQAGAPRATPKCQERRPATYEELALDLAKRRVCVELFLAPQHVMDVPALSPLSRCTGGELHHFPCFDAARDARSLSRELLHVLGRRTAFAAELRLRVTRGWRLGKVQGRFYQRRPGHLLLANCSEDLAFMAELERDGSAGGLCVQAALTYTDGAGQRRTRVLTSAWASAASSAESVASLDAPVAAALLIAEAVRCGAEARSRLLGRCRQLLQSVGPEALGPLPLCVLGALKSEALSCPARLEGLSLERFLAVFSPRLVSLLRPSGPLPLSAASLEEEGAYVLEHGEGLYLWLGRRAPEALESLALAGLDGEGPLADVLGACHRGLRLEIARQGSGEVAERRFLGLLVEDRAASGQSYAEFLQSLRLGSPATCAPTG